MIGLRSFIASAAAGAAMAVGLVASATLANADDVCPSVIQFEEELHPAGVWFLYDQAVLFQVTDKYCIYEVDLYIIDDRTGSGTYEGVVKRQIIRPDLRP